MVTEIETIMNAELKHELMYTTTSPITYIHNHIVLLLPLCYSVEIIKQQQYNMVEHQRYVLTVFNYYYPGLCDDIDSNFIKYHIVKAKRIIQRYIEA